MVPHDVEDHPQPRRVCRVDQVTQLRVGGGGAGREARLGDQEVVDAVPVVGTGVPAEVL